MQIIKYNTREHKLILRVFAHSSKVEKKVMMNVANEINKLKEEDWKGKGLYPIEIPMSALIERTQSNYEAIKRICDNVMSKIIQMEIPYKLKNGKTEIFKSFVCVFPECGISDNTFRIEVKETVLPLFSRTLEVYRHYNIIEAKFLTHKHSIELYKFLKDKYNQSKTEFTIDLGVLRAELGLENKYKLYGHLKNRVLEPAKEDMKNNSVLWFEYKEIKRSRSVTDLIFYIHTNKEKEQEIYTNERIRIYTKTTTENKFKEDFLHFLEEDYYFSKLSKTIDYSDLEKAKLSLKTKTSLKDYSLKIQKQFIDFLEPSIL
jgi:plasmid replication initiation protein